MKNTMILVILLVCNIIVCSSNSIDSSILSSLLFYETFDNGNDIFTTGKWIKSNADKFKEQPILVRPAKQPASGYENDNGLQLSQANFHYGVVAPFKEPLKLIEGKEIVIQYELKLEDTLACGGAYVKLPRINDFKNFDSDTPYSIMFGPDKCGSNNNKVHFIIQHQNPITKQWEEKHFNDTATVKMDKKTHLYTLALKSDNTFTIFIDRKIAKSGNLLIAMKPPVNPSKMIDDPEDKKPVDWVDQMEIEDPNAKKPDDWDDNAPRMIPDPNAVKPVGWLDNAPHKIPDPTAVKPADWIDDEDGDWSPNLIPNPECAKVGCGIWTPPSVKNPKHKGVWKRPKIKNPKYQGTWYPKQIENPNYYTDLTPAMNLAPMAGIAIEVWTTTAGILFDNFVVSTSIDAAFNFADATFKLKQEAEMKKPDKKKDHKKKSVSKKIEDKKIKLGKANNKQEANNDYVEAVKSIFNKAIDDAKRNPWPFVSAVLALILVNTLLFRRTQKSSTKASAKEEPEKED